MTFETIKRISPKVQQKDLILEVRRGDGIVHTGDVVSMALCKYKRIKLTIELVEFFEVLRIERPNVQSSYVGFDSGKDE